jgi:superfamily I DNA/RNA helicase
VGDSFHTHGFSDELLAARGGDAREILSRELAFDKGQILLGHNLAFDLRLLRNHAARLGLEVAFPPWFDTMPLASVMLPVEKLKGLRLESVAQAVGVELPRAHDAEADARASLQILEQWIPELEARREARLEFLQHMDREVALAIQKTSTLFRAAAEAEAACDAVARLIEQVWERLRSTPGEHDYRANPVRAKNIADLVAVARFLDARHGAPVSLPMFLEQVSLSRRDMLLETGPDRIRLLSAHAAKGLEFDAVALPRLQKPWPDYSDEEARVFYVMLTRARRHLWLGSVKSVKTHYGNLVPSERLKYLGALQDWVR